MTLNTSGWLWRHLKRGTFYRIVGEAGLQSEFPIEEGKLLTIYRSEADGKLWARPIEEFNDGRFERTVPIDTKTPAKIDESHNRVSKAEQKALVDRNGWLQDIESDFGVPARQAAFNACEAAMAPLLELIRDFQRKAMTVGPLHHELPKVDSSPAPGQVLR